MWHRKAIRHTHTCLAAPLLVAPGPERHAPSAIPFRSWELPAAHSFSHPPCDQPGPTETVATRQPLAMRARLWPAILRYGRKPHIQAYQHIVMIWCIPLAAPPQDAPCFPATLLHARVRLLAIGIPSKNLYGCQVRLRALLQTRDYRTHPWQQDSKPPHAHMARTATTMHISGARRTEGWYTIAAVDVSQRQTHRHMQNGGRLATALAARTGCGRSRRTFPILLTHPERRPSLTTAATPRDIAMQHGPPNMPSLGERTPLPPSAPVPAPTA